MIGLAKMDNPINSKSEFLNSKQIQIFKSQNLKISSKNFFSIIKIIVFLVLILAYAYDTVSANKLFKTNFYLLG